MLGIERKRKEYLNIMLDERDYCAINVNHDVELFGERIKPKQKMSYPKLNCFDPCVVAYNEHTYRFR